MRVWKAGGEIRGWDHGLAVARALRGGDEAAMRVQAVSEGRGDAQQARGRTGRSGELALGCEWRAARGKGRERGAGWALLGQARERGSWVELGWTDRGSRLGRGWFVELGWVDFGSLGWFPFSSLSPLFYFPTTLKLFEFKVEFEFNPSTQTNKTMHQHECTNKLALK